MICADSSEIRRQTERLGMPVCDAILQALQETTPAGEPVPTILAVCPTSPAVVRAALQASKEAEAPLFFAATLNQVDIDGGYTGWTPAGFVRLVGELAKEVGYTGPVVVGLDHGGPWLKHTHQQWPLARAMEGVKESLVACLDAGYDLLRVDPTVDRTLPPGEGISVEVVVQRTLELITRAKPIAARRGCRQ